MTGFGANATGRAYAISSMYTASPATAQRADWNSKMDFAPCANHIRQNPSKMARSGHPRPGLDVIVRELRELREQPVFRHAPGKRSGMSPTVSPRTHRLPTRPAPGLTAELA
jgi:hypothetical protein